MLRIRVLDLDRPELTLEFKWWILCSELEDYIVRFGGHLALSLGIRKTKQFPVGRHTALAKTPIKATVREVVQKGHA